MEKEPTITNQEKLPIEHQSSKELWDDIHYMLNRYGDDILYRNPRVNAEIEELKRRGELD